MGYYDRIIPPPAMIACRRLGIPKSAAVMITTVLNNMIYRLRTGHGLSARTYMSNKIRRILGVGQGRCASPAIWMAVLDPILWSIAQKFHGFQVETPSGKRIRRIGDGYVDDMTLTTTLPDNTKEKEELQTITELM